MTTLVLLLLVIVGGAAWYASGRLHAQQIGTLAEEPASDPAFFPFLAVYFTLLIKVAQADGHLGDQEIDFARRHLRRTARITSGGAFSETDLARLEDAILERGHTMSLEDTAALVHNTYHEVAPESGAQAFFEDAFTALASIAALDGTLRLDEEAALSAIAEAFGILPKRYAQLRAVVLQELAPHVEARPASDDAPPGAEAFDPAAVDESTAQKHYGAVLGLSGRLTKSDLRRRYRSALALYHPDKVAHLGPELRALAERKTKEINEAYAWFAQRYQL